MSVALLAYRAVRRRGYEPFVLGLAGAIAIVTGNFYLDNDFLHKDYVGYAGIILLVAASAWNAWPRKGATGTTFHPESFNEKKEGGNIMATRTIEVFSAGCPLCNDTLEMVNRMACPSCEVTVVDMQDIKGATRARELGVTSVPAVAVNGELAGCCAGRGPDEATRSEERRVGKECRSRWSP